MKKCILCGHGVARGNRHARFACPPTAGSGRGQHGKVAKVASHLSEIIFNTRGESVPGIHKLAASSKVMK
jgi:hypothetical protein